MNWPHAMPLLLLSLLIIWSLYRRVRRTIAPARLVPRRLYLRAALFLAVEALSTVSFAMHVWDDVSAAIGLCAGIGLAVFAYRTTRYEHRPDGWYYRTNAAVGVVLITLFIARLVWRTAFVYEEVASATAHPGTPSTASDPLTAAILFVLFTYYAVYFLLLAAKARTLTAEQDSARGPRGSGST
ncbi:hypothetical protein GCM10010885_20530 [Alicyclobacillus cellulosilyticus]|uniref:DUF1453 domain-containing protein n=1 Tax=Alicyclobacillus cellulosilyticus TaxID=1003997 RepID=A0A917KEG2_9BACL|nr:CcdC protein domain-containing protein [Alicyclobacillus cellulosilyticus]GGJ11152.1 hypothetical protein GCM10010885_20530 [Alicyclobacillus cellulosilyticus]